MTRGMCWACVLILSVAPGLGAQESQPSFLLQWGASGSAPEEFSQPSALSVDDAGNVYVADTHNHRVQKFDADGQFLSSWGPKGDVQVPFDRPTSVEVGPDGTVYVGDADRIRQITPTGVQLQEWPTHCRSLAVGPDGSLFVTTGFNVVRKYAPDGTLLREWGGTGLGEDGRFNFAGGIAVDAIGNVYVSDRDEHNVEKFDSDGTFLGTWDLDHLADPIEISVDDAGRVYVAEFWRERISVYSDGTLVARWGAQGVGPGEFLGPYDVAVGPQGEVYVTDISARIQKFSFDPVAVSPATWGRIKTLYSN